MISSLILYGPIIATKLPAPTRSPRHILFSFVIDLLIINSYVVSKINYFHPLLFIISVNDLCNVSPMFFKILYADDTCVLISGNHLNNLIDRLNTELIFKNNWFKAKKLSLHTKKSFFIIFHSSRIKPNVINKVVIDNHELTQVNSAKYLGVIIDHKLNWIEHIS